MAKLKRSKRAGGALESQAQDVEMDENGERIKPDSSAIGGPRRRTRQEFEPNNNLPQMSNEASEIVAGSKVKNARNKHMQSKQENKENNKGRGRQAA